MPNCKHPYVYPMHATFMGRVILIFRQCQLCRHCF